MASTAKNAVLTPSGLCGASSIAKYHTVRKNVSLEEKKTLLQFGRNSPEYRSQFRRDASLKALNKDTSIYSTTTLREENEALRAKVKELLIKMDDAKRAALLQKHGTLVEAGRGVGENIPSLEDSISYPEDPVVDEPACVASEEPASPPPATSETSSPTAEAVVMNDSGVSAVVEVERDNTLVFKFGSFSTSESTASVTNRDIATSLSAGARPFQSSLPRAVGTWALSGGKDGGDGAITFTFGNEKNNSPEVETTAVENVEVIQEDVPTRGNGSSGSESAADSAGTKSRRRRSTDKASSAPASSMRKATSNRTSKTTKKSSHLDPYADIRASATKETRNHDPTVVLRGREHWLYVSVPETPIAGAECVLYFNRAQSGTLKFCPKVQLHAKFNNWELAPEGDQGDRVDMTPETDGAPKSEGSDFWRATLTFPENAYEISFIFGDGEGVYDNNDSQNYSLPAEGPMTRELWIDTAPERAEAAYLARKEAERVANEAASKEREIAALEADANRAKHIVSELKGSYSAWREGALGVAQGENGMLLWTSVPPSATAGSSIQLLYNRTAGPLGSIPIPENEHLILKIGHNSWTNPMDIKMTRTATVKGATSSDDWWGATVGVPPSAAVLNFVIQYYDHYDNNGGSDHKLAVNLPAGATSVDAWADGLLSSITTAVTTARKNEEAAVEAMERMKTEAREAVRAKSEEVRRRQMRHVLFTEPPRPAAGKEVTIYYNPDNTVLHGAERVFLHGGYNRWRHPKSYGPVELTSSSAGDHFSATVTVPKDAYSLDFVFSDAEEGGRFDNCGGLDYNLPVEGSVVGEPPLYVVHVAVEMAPICKVGGLGDVVTALGRAVQESGHQVEVILPRYDFFLQSPLLGATKYETEFEWAGTRIFVSSCIVEGLRCWFIEPGNGTFATSTVYQGATDAERFAFFSRAALEFLLRTGRQPDILHCHDWSTADVAKAYWTEYHHYGLWKPSVVFTIHNLNYGAAQIGEAAYFSQRFTTVSPTYAWEIGGHPAVVSNNFKLMGIRNGIDIDIWNPESDQFLPLSYNADNAEAGKAAAREELRRRVGLTGWGDKPLVGVVTRLTKQKGTQLIAHSCYRTLDRGGQFILLGSAPDPKVQAEFDALATAHAGENAAFCFAFDEPLSHLIYAACDIILVPSMFEPCGLTQMIAMRYGSVPVVRATGGLKDTVFDVDTDKERAAWELEGSTNWVADGVDATNGFAFEGTDPGALDYALNRALDAWYNDRAWFRSLQQRVMRQDWSWNKPAIDYIQLYYAALKK